MCCPGWAALIICANSSCRDHSSLTAPLHPSWPWPVPGPASFQPEKFLDTSGALKRSPAFLSFSGQCHAVCLWGECQPSLFFLNISQFLSSDRWYSWAQVTRGKGNPDLFQSNLFLSMPSSFRSCRSRQAIKTPKGVSENSIHLLFQKI